VVSLTAVAALWRLADELEQQSVELVLRGFPGCIGVFGANDTLDGKSIGVRFTRNANSSGNPIWEQAFSADDGTRWETN